MRVSRIRALIGIMAFAGAGLMAGTASAAPPAIIELGTFHDGETVSMPYDCTTATSAQGQLLDASMNVIDTGPVAIVSTTLAVLANQLTNGKYYVMIDCLDDQGATTQRVTYGFTIDVCGPQVTLPADTTAVTELPAGPSRRPHGQAPTCPTTTTGVGSGGGGLPSTGSASSPIAALGGFAVVIGGGALVLVRRRNTAAVNG